MRSHRRGRVAAIAAALAVLAAGAASAAPRTYVVDTARSQMTVRVFRAGALSGLGHDHTFTVGTWAGNVRFDPSAPQATQVEMRVQADSLYDTEPGLSKTDHAKVNAQTRDTVLESAKYPTIEFRAERLELGQPPAVGGTGGQPEQLTGQLKGTLTLHGTTKPVSVPFTATVSGDGFSGSGSVPLNLREYGIKPPSAALGTVAVKDQVEIHFQLVGRSGE